MYKKILVPMALTHDISSQTLQIARALLAEGGAIVALHVYEVPHGSVTPYLDEKLIAELMGRAESLLREKTAGHADVTPVLLKGHTGRAIIDYAEANGVDCIVMGSHKPGMTDFLLGSTAARVVRHAPCAVHVQRTAQ